MTKRALLVGITVLFVSVAVYAGGFALSGVGSKAIGMGGAFRGLADNWSAAYWNPAGLCQLSQSEFNFMGIAINPRPEYKPDITYNGYDIGYKNGQFIINDPHPKFGGSLKVKPDILIASIYSRKIPEMIVIK